MLPVGNPCSEHAPVTAEGPTGRAAGPAASTTLAFKRRRWESNPLEVAALQAAAAPSGSSVIVGHTGTRSVPATFSISVLARNRTWSSTFAGSRAHPAHPEDNQARARGVEPRKPVLEAGGSPRS